jgi:hypothetical protein
VDGRDATNFFLFLPHLTHAAGRVRSSMNVRRFRRTSRQAICTVRESEQSPRRCRRLPFQDSAELMSAYLLVPVMDASLFDIENGDL